MLRVQTAAARPGGEPGVFSPDQLQSAVRQLDPTRLKGAYARGNALMQDFADYASAALKPPSLGAAGHGAGVAGGLLAGGALEHFLSDPKAAAALAAAYPVLAGLYSNTGRALLNPAIAGLSALGPRLGALTPLAAQLAARNNRWAPAPMAPQPQPPPSYPGSLMPGGAWPVR
jgi:hypothetical protein